MHKGCKVCECSPHVIISAAHPQVLGCFFAQATPLAKESPEVQVLDSQRIALGPVAAVSNSDVTKSLSFALPPGADADIFRLGEALGGPLAPAGARGAGQGMSASAGAPAPAFTDAMKQALRASSDPMGAAFGG